MLRRLASIAVTLSSVFALASSAWATPVGIGGPNNFDPSFRFRNPPPPPPRVVSPPPPAQAPRTNIAPLATRTGVRPLPPRGADGRFMKAGRTLVDGKTVGITGGAPLARRPAAGQPWQASGVVRGVGAPIVAETAQRVTPLRDAKGELLRQPVRFQKDGKTYVYYPDQQSLRGEK